MASTGTRWGRVQEYEGRDYNSSPRIRPFPSSQSVYLGLHHSSSFCPSHYASSGQNHPAVDIDPLSSDEVALHNEEVCFGNLQESSALDPLRMPITHLVRGCNMFNQQTVSHCRVHGLLVAVWHCPPQLNERLIFVPATLRDILFYLCFHL